MGTATVRIPVGTEFRLRPTIRSHGWSDLRPFETDEKGTRLAVTLLLEGAVAVRAEVSVEGGLSARLACASRLTPARRAAAVSALRDCLHADLDLAPFWALCREDPDLAWAAEARAGRYLRAPTAFADAAMVLATTNCSWGLTRRIVAGLVGRWGVGGAFPTQEAIASASVADLREHGRLGYRAPYLRELARGPDLATLREDRGPTGALRRRLLDLPGFGPYAAENMMRLLGRFEHLALDSWVAGRWKKMFPATRSVEASIGRRVARFGEWRGLALWLLVTAGWHRREGWRDAL